MTETPSQPAEKRVEEFLRQRAMGRGQHPTTIHEIHMDRHAEAATLTVRDLEVLIDKAIALATVAPTAAALIETRTTA